MNREDRDMLLNQQIRYGLSLTKKLESLLQYMKEELGITERVESFNDVWSGLGPDCRTMPAKAG